MQNNGYWPYVSNLAFLSQRQNETKYKHTFIYEHKSEQNFIFVFMYECIFVVCLIYFAFEKEPARFET